jgi:tetratricopeptide (TPR) repeat protein
MSGLRAFGLVLLISSAAWAQVDPMTALAERAGWDALAAGRASAAAEAFRRALEGDPKNGRIHLGAAMAAFLEKRNADARAEAERALELDPKLSQAYEVLGQARHRLGDVRGAIRAFESLTTAKPEHAEAAETLERWRREADLHDRMQQAVGSHFTVSFEGPAEGDLAREALASLDRAYWRIGEQLAVFPAQPIPVVLYTTQQFSDITRSPSWAAGAYDGVIRVPMRGALQNPKELDRILAHEFTHAIVRGLAPRGVPTWLNEGLATVLESEDRDGAERHAAAGESIPLSDLQASFGRFSGKQASQAYATSARVVRQLMDTAGSFAIANLLRDLGQGVDFETAFLHRIQRSFADFQRTATETQGH